MNTQFFIIGMWVTVIGAMFASWMIVELCWIVAARLFGIVDSYMQDRHWKREGYARVKADDGKDWYVSGYYVDGHNWGDE